MPIPRDLTRAMLAFGAMLRHHGLPVTTGALMDLVRALEVVNLMDRDEVYLALRTLLVSRVEEQSTFERCFDDFWQFRPDCLQNLEQISNSLRIRKSGGPWRTAVTRQHSIKSAGHGRYGYGR